MKRERPPVQTLTHLETAELYKERAVKKESPASLEEMETLIQRWAEIAATHAILESIDDPPGFVATVSRAKGAWGFGESEQAAVDDLRSVLVGWAILKLEDGDDDIPSMEGIQLVSGR